MDFIIAWKFYSETVVGCALPNEENGESKRNESEVEVVEQSLVGQWSTYGLEQKIQSL